MITIDGFEFKGTHGAAVSAPPQLRVMRKAFSGVDGESEIKGGKTGREVSVDIVVHERLNASQMEAVLGVYEYQILGRHGTLLVRADTGYDQAFANTTYMGFERDPETPAPLYDYANTIDGRWWIRGRLKFYQLLVT